ncbi:hypothetical protein HKCCSP123_02365 [Rhodobacterales bacterium HKCCSP123]|nr:hypothetical protein [Rhodobacterales bacterium HKCCSP123]
MAGRTLVELDKDRLVPLLRDLAALLDGVGGQQGWIASLRFGAAGALAEFGDFHGAAPLYRGLVAQTPLHAWAWIGLVDALCALGATGDAVEAGREALHHLPGNMLLWKRTARALREHAGPGAAAGFFSAALGTDPSQRDLDFAISLYREAGEAGQAAELCHRLLRQDPGAPVAHMALIEGALASRDAETARDASRAALARSPAHPELRLRIAQGLFAAGDAAAAIGALDALPPGAAFDVEAGTLRRRCEACLGDAGNVQEPSTRARPTIGGGRPDPAPPAPSRPDPADLDAALAAGDTEASALILDRLLSARDLPWYVALRIVERARRCRSDEAARAVLAAFAGADWPAEDRQAFEIEQRLLRLGPRFALDWIRANPVASRGREAAERVGRVLLGGGSGPLAARYLRACCRRWPEDRALAGLAAIACEACGLSGPGPGREPSIQSLARDGATSPRVRRIETCLLAGDLTRAEAELGRLRIEDGPLEAALIRRPRATRIGSLLNEARILAAAGIDWTGGDADMLAPLAEGFFLPARGIVAGLASMPCDGKAGTPLPETVHLVWPSSAPPSEEAGRLFEAWRTATRREVSVHLVSDGAASMDEAGGDAAVRAFRVTQDDAQKADLVFLALAVIHGGAIVAADQWPSPSVDALFDADHGALLFRDGDGSLSLDALLAPAGHPLTRAALDQVVASCLARDNDHRWFKTGPGLMTRAVARHLLRTDPDDAPVCLRPIADLRRHMHRHSTVVPPPARETRDAADTGLALALAREIDGTGSAGRHVR